MLPPLLKHCVIFLMAFWVYVRTLCGSFNINDSGETITICANLWIGHSPGYPLHTILGKLFTGLGIGTPMFQVSLFSAVAAALVIALLPVLLTRYGFSPLAQACGMVLFALSENYWLQAGGAKGGIYTLGTLFMVVVLIAVEHLNRAPLTPGLMALIGFLIAGMLAHHWQSMAFGPALVILGLPFLRKLWGNKRAVLHCLPGILLGAIPIFILPLRAIQDLPLNWGRPSTWEALSWTLRREGYQGIGDIRGWQTIQRNFVRFWGDFLDQFMVAPEANDRVFSAAFMTLFLTAALCGLFLVGRRNPRVAGGLFLLGMIVAGAVIFYTNSREGYEWVIDNFFTPFYLMMALFVAEAVAKGVEVLGRFAGGSLLRGAAAGVAFLILGGSTALSNIHRCDQKDYLLGYDYGKNLLLCAPPNALIMCAGDIDVLPLWYFRYVEGFRTDITVVTAQLLPYSWYRDAIAKEDPRLALPFGDGIVNMDVAGSAMMRKALLYRPVTYTFIFTRPFMRKFPSVIRGILWEVVTAKETEIPYDPREMDRVFGSFLMRGCLDPRVYKDEYTQVLVDSYGTAHDSIAYTALSKKWYQTAVHELHRAIPLRRPQALPAIRSNLGAAYRGLGDLEAAARSYGQALALSPGEIKIHFRLGKVLLDLGREEEARSYFRTVARRADRKDLVRLAGIELEKLGDQKGVQEALARWKSLEGSLPRGPKTVLVPQKM